MNNICVIEKGLLENSKFETTEISAGTKIETDQVIDYFKAKGYQLNIDITKKQDGHGVIFTNPKSTEVYRVQCQPSF